MRPTAAADFKMEAANQVGPLNPQGKQTATGKKQKVKIEGDVADAKSAMKNSKGKKVGDKRGASAVPAGSVTEVEN